jgi:hypothetical protein
MTADVMAATNHPTSSLCSLVWFDAWLTQGCTYCSLICVAPFAPDFFNNLDVLIQMLSTRNDIRLTAAHTYPANPCE